MCRLINIQEISIWVPILNPSSTTAWFWNLRSHKYIPSSAPWPWTIVNVFNTCYSSINKGTGFMVTTIFKPEGASMPARLGNTLNFICHVHVNSTAVTCHRDTIKWTVSCDMPSCMNLKAELLNKIWILAEFGYGVEEKCSHCEHLKLHTSSEH